MSAPSVVAVLPHFLASTSRVRRIADSVLNQQGLARCHLVVVANRPYSTDLLDVHGIPRVELLEPGLNLGYVGALEWVRRRASADFLWVLQEDIEPFPDCLQRLLAAFDDHRSGSPLAVASPIERYRDGRMSPMTRMSNFDLDTGDMEPLSRPLGQRGIQSAEWNGGRTVTFVPLSGALLSVEALESSGGFDINLWPLQYVDVDACIALQFAGYSIRLVDDAAIYHDRSLVRGSSRSRDWKVVANTRNRARLVEKYSSAVETPTPVAVDVPPDLLYSVARSMSEFLSDYSQWVDANLRKRPTWHFRRLLRRIRRIMR